VAKFLQTLDPEVYRKIKEVAKRRGQTVQELIRTIVGEWLETRR
jgi:predicted DNA-binding ribbon-helix-helix protein